MAMEDGEIRWFSPDPRTFLPLDNFHIPHGLKRERRAQAIEIRIDTRFADVIQACAARDDTWINDEIIASYSQLHELGHAHSVEAWSADELVGGLYGVAIGGAFFGESMFHRTTGASKIALWALIDHLRARDWNRQPDLIGRWRSPKRSRTATPPKRGTRSVSSRTGPPLAMGLSSSCDNDLHFENVLSTIAGQSR